jgi:hypothetical protein
MVDLSVRAWCIARSVTGQDATATQELVKIALEDQRRAIEPMVVVAKRERLSLVTEQGVSTATRQVTLRNVGKGPALDIGLSTYTLTDTGHIEDEMPAGRVTAIAPLDEEIVVIQTHNLADPLQIGSTFTDSSERGDRLTFGFHGIKRRRDEAGSVPP